MRTSRNCLLACVLLAAGAHASETTLTLLGAQADLEAAATALAVRDYARVLRLTRRGLQSEMSVLNRAGALSNLCAALVGLRRHGEAVTECNRAIGLLPGHWQAYNNRALAYLGLGWVEAARRDVRRGLALNPDAGPLQEVSELAKFPAHRTTLLASIAADSSADPRGTAAGLPAGLAK